MIRLIWLLCFLLIGGCNGEVSAEKSSPVPSASATNPHQTSKQKCSNTLLSWNGGNFGVSKKEKEIAVFADVIRSSGATVVALQEVTAGKGFGARKVAELATELGTEWDSITSDPTQPQDSETERYAFLWKKSIYEVSRHEATLTRELAETISREPYRIILKPKKGGASITLYTIHTVPTAKGPTGEVASLVDFLRDQAGATIVAGDFNLGRNSLDPLFLPLGFTGHIREATSLKTKTQESGNYRSRPYDNIYTKGVTVCASGVFDFVAMKYAPVDDDTLKAARKVSDHLPVWMSWDWFWQRLVRCLFLW
jgi:endonuclease/exonuclease/phosphatase family metal-dependent hydrolase